MDEGKKNTLLGENTGPLKYFLPPSSSYPSLSSLLFFFSSSPTNALNLDVSLTSFFVRCSTLTLLFLFILFLSPRDTQVSPPRALVHHYFALRGKYLAIDKPPTNKINHKHHTKRL